MIIYHLNKTILCLLILTGSTVFGKGIDSLILDHKPKAYPAPLYLKVLSVYEGKLYYETGGATPTRKSPLYKGIIKLSSPKEYSLKFLYENPFGEERYFGPFEYNLTPPRGFGQNLPEPSISGGVYDSILFITFRKLEKAEIYYSLNDSLSLAKYTGQKIMLDTTCTLYYKAVYTDLLATDLFAEHYEIFLSAPKVYLATKLRNFNFEPKLKITLEKASKAFYSLDPLAPHSSFSPVKDFVKLPEGRHLLRLYAKNAVGMKSEEVRYRIMVDATPPVVKYYVDTRKKVAILSTNEPGDIRFTLDGSTPDLKSMKYTTPIPLPDDGVVPIRFFAVDSIGNESKLLGFRASADMGPPEVKITPTPGSYTRPVDVKLTCGEPCVIRYSLDGSDPANSSRTITDPSMKIAIRKEGTTVLRYVARDESGNPSELYREEFIVDTKPPKVKLRITQLATGKKLSLEFETDEPATIYYTTDGRKPTKKSKAYADDLTIAPGTPLRFIAVDQLNNQSEQQLLEDLIKSSIILSPGGGIYNASIEVAMETSQRGPILWKATRDGKSLEGEDFQSYTSPIQLGYSGVYVLSYYISDGKGETNIQEQMYIIDKTPPRVVPVLERSREDSSFFLIFDTDEPTKIYYTLDGSLPTETNALTVGSSFQEKETRINVQRKGKRVLKYFGVDRADNHSPVYELDMFSPHVTTQPPPGMYHDLITLKLVTQEGNTIYYSEDSASLSSKSNVYGKPIVIKKTQELWFFAVDITGFAGPRQKAVYRLNFSPEPRFSFSKASIMAGESVVLDGSLSVDEETPPDKLLFRWDLNNDGKFDTEFRSSPSISTSFDRPGLHEVVLEIKDSENLTDRITEPVNVSKRCPSDMASISSPDYNFCIEHYEWPNKKGEKPLYNVNWAEASMLCMEKGRRLCTGEEWEIACKGKWNHFFSYGNAFQEGTCNTESEETVLSAQNSGCVSSDGVYDLVGNLWEWVDGYEEGQHIIVGGSFRQSTASSCGLSLPSQIGTKAQTIGFRCCQ